MQEAAEGAKLGQRKQDVSTHEELLRKELAEACEALGGEFEEFTGQVFCEVGDEEETTLQLLDSTLEIYTKGILRKATVRNVHSIHIIEDTVSIWERIPEDPERGNVAINLRRKLE